MGQPGSFDLDERYRRLLENGDPQVKLAALIDFEAFRPKLATALKRSDGSKGGRPPSDAVLMFKILILQTLYTLSDDGTEWTCLGLVESGLGSASFLEMDGADEAEVGMLSARIIEDIDVAGQGLGRLSPGLEDGAPDHLALQCLEKSLDHSIIITVTLAGH